MREALGITCGAALDMFLRLSFYSQIDLVCSYFYSLRFCVKVEMTYIAFRGVHFVQFGRKFGL